MNTRRGAERLASQTGPKTRRRRHDLSADSPTAAEAEKPAETTPIEPPGSDGFAPADRSQPELDHADANQAAEEILGANPLIGFDTREILDGLGRLAKLMTLEPGIMLREQVNLGRELLKVITGASEQEPDPKDR